jgi:hypothetical protein
LYFGSKDQPGPAGSCATAFAIIGGLGGRTAGLYADHSGLNAGGRNAAPAGDTSVRAPVVAP